MSLKAKRDRLITIRNALLLLSLFEAIIQENAMIRPTAEPRIAEDGVTFTVEVGFTDRECLISRNALAHLRRLQGGPMDFMATYRAYEDQIHSVARRLVVAGVGGIPLMLGASYFV